MERLILDAEELDSSFTASRDSNGELAMSYADIVDAIHIVQTEMDITGTTAKEASTTIEGSINTMKSAWQNLVTGLGDSNADVGMLVNQLMDSIDIVVNNVEPVVENVMNSISTALPTAFSKLMSLITNNLTTLLPSLITAVKGMVGSIAKALPSMASSILNELPSLLSTLIDGLGEIIPDLIPALMDVLTNALSNLPSLLATAVKGIFTAGKGIITGLYNGIAKQFEASVPSDIATGTVGKIKNNFQEAMSDGMRNLQSVFASITGNADWSEALNNLKIADQIESEIVSSYNTAMDTLKKHSFENFQLETEAKISSAMSLVGCLTGMIDADGNITGNIDVVESYIKQINDILGADAVTLDETPADWILNIADKYKDENGNYTDPESIKSDIIDGLNKIFGGEEGAEAIELAEATYTAVSSVLSGYTQAQAIEDKDKIRNDIQKKLEAVGVPSTTAKVIAEASVEEGNISTWFNTGVSTRWDNSAFIDSLMAEGILQNPNNEADRAKADAVAEIATQFVMGDIDREQFDEKLAELDLTPEQREQIITYTVDTTQLDEAIVKLEEYLNEAYRTQIINDMISATSDMYKEYTAAVRAQRDAQQDLNDAIEGGDWHAITSEISATVDGYNNVKMAANAYAEELDYTSEQLWLMDTALGRTDKTLAEYQEDFRETNGIHQSMTASLGELKTNTMTAVAELLNLKGGSEQATSAFAGLWEQLENNQITQEQFIDTLGNLQQGMESLTNGTEIDATTWDTWGAVIGIDGETFKQFAQDLSDGNYKITESSDAVDTTNIQNQLKETYKSAKKNLSDTQTAMDGFSTAGFGAKMEGVKGIVEDSTDNSDTASENTAESIQAMADEVDNKMFDLNRAFDKIRAKAIEYLGADSAFQKAISSAGANVPKALAEGITNNMFSFNNALSGLTSSSSTTGNSFYTSMLQVGKYAAQGLIDGMLNMQNYVYNAARKLAEAAERGARITLEIHSPSKVFEELGEFTAEGFTVGLDNMQNAVAESTSALSDIATENMNPTVGIDYAVESTKPSEVEALEDKLDEVIDAVKGMKVYLDGKKLVGNIMTDLNSNFEALNVRNSRGGLAYV